MTTYALKKRVSARQTLIVAYLAFGFADLTSGQDGFAIEVPAGAIIHSGALDVDTVWNSATSDVLSVGDAASYNRYLSASDIHTGTTAAHAPLVPTGYVYTAPTLLTVRWVGVSTAPTTGAARLAVAYYMKGRSDLGGQGLDYGSRLA